MGHPRRVLLCALLTVTVALSAGASAGLADSGPQYGSIGQYGELWRGGGFDTSAYDGGRYDKPLTAGKFLDPVGFTVDSADQTPQGDGTAVYVLDRTSRLPGFLAGGATTWRLQKLDDRGGVIGTDEFSLPADGNHYEMLGLSVAPSEGRVYALLIAYDPTVGVERLEEVLGWSTTPQGARLVAAPGLSTDALSAGVNGDPTPGRLTTVAQLTRSNGFPSVIAPEGVAFDATGGSDFLAVQSADGTSNGAASGIAQISATTGDLAKQWSGIKLDQAKLAVGESSYTPAGISTAPDGSLTLLLDEQTGATPSNIDVVDLQANLAKPRILASIANAAENPDDSSLATDDAAIFTSDAVPETLDADGKTGATLLAAPQFVALTNGLYAGEFEPDPAGSPDPQNPAGGPGLWTNATPGIRLLDPASEANGTVSNLQPPLLSLFDTLGNPAPNTGGKTDPASACGLTDDVTASGGETASPFPSLAAGANGTLWVLTRGTDSSTGSGGAFQGARQLIELAPGGSGDPCPTPSGTFTMADGNGPAQPATRALTLQSGDTATFDASGIDYLGGATAQYEWTFGDGNGTTVLGSASSPFTWPTPTASEQYADVGTYTVTLKVLGDFGEYDVSATVNVVPSSPPKGVFTFSPGAPQADAIVGFDASGSTPSADALLIDYYWDWGDGTIDETSSSSDSHVYGQPGTYTVHMRVRDSRNELSTPTSQSVTVSPAPAPPLTTTPSSPPLPAPAPIAAPDVRGKLGSRTPRRGRVHMLVSCPADQTSCAGTVQLQTDTGKHRRTVGTSSFTIAGGRSATVLVKLSAGALATLKKSHSLRLIATIRASNPEGTSGTRSIRLTLHRSNPRHRRT